MKSKKQTLILSGVIIATLVILIVGATYAYFQATGGNSSSSEVNVTTYTSDLLTFEIEKDITIYADATSFAEGKGNATDSTYAKATLLANNKTNEATKTYYMYLDITSNTLEYTQNENTPELLLTITDENGNPVTNITSLSYKTVSDGKGASISGYDITTKTGLITLFDKKEITATPRKVDTWNVTVTLVNLNANQTKNAGKSFVAKLKLQNTEENGNTVAICDSGTTLADCVKSQYTGTQGDNSIYYHNGTITGDDGTVLDAGDNSYRYAGASDKVNNFVCFGTNENPCPEESLYRILGVIDDKIKLVKYDYASSDLLGTDGDYASSATPDSSYYKGNLTSVNTYSWNYNATNSSKNTWSTSLLNKTNLNTNFIDKIGSTWSNKIATTTWKVGGAPLAIGMKIPSVAYQLELGNNTSTTYNSKIGLMYIIDYYFAAASNAWTLVGRNSSDTTKDYSAATNNNWMYMGFDEWVISCISGISNSANAIRSDGGLGGVNTGKMFGVRPSFNLESSVKYVSGSGSMSDPIIIK